jgi:hypothetical protein
VVTWPGGAGVGGVNDAGGRLAGKLGPGVLIVGVVPGDAAAEAPGEPDGAAEAPGEPVGAAEAPGEPDGAGEPDGLADGAAEAPGSRRGRGPTRQGLRTGSASG